MPHVRSGTRLMGSPGSSAYPTSRGTLRPTAMGVLVGSNSSEIDASSRSRAPASPRPTPSSIVPSEFDCRVCPLKARFVLEEPARKIHRSIHEDARNIARELSKTDAYARSRHQRKKVEVLFAHLKRVLKLDRLRLRGPTGAHDEFLLAATAQNLRRMAMWLSTGPPGHRIPAPA